ncbi:4873_t:CDS:1, partial [Diversispora eburnea]
SNSKLQLIIIKILSILTSSTTSEYNFSTFEFIHNKIHNYLYNDHVKKLVYIYTNLKIHDNKKLDKLNKINIKIGNKNNESIEEEIDINKEINKGDDNILQDFDLISENINLIDLIDDLNNNYNK